LIRVILARPQGPRNVGSVLRVIANFGPAELIIAGPVRPSLLVHPDFTQMAHGVAGGAERVRSVGSLREALLDCTGSVGFTSRARDHRTVRDWRDARHGVMQRAASPDEVLALVFGNEESGLSVEETNPLQELIRIPTTDEHTSLNLAMSVGLVLSTFFLDTAPTTGSEGSTHLTGVDREFLKRRATIVLGACARTEPARRDLKASIERVFDRAPLETRDARAWHLLLRSLGDESTPAELGLGQEPVNGPEA